MTETMNSLVRELREGLCVEDQRCKVRDAKSGCDCARIADYIEELQSALKALINTFDARPDFQPLLGWQEHAEIEAARAALARATSTTTEGR